MFGLGMIADDGRGMLFCVGGRNGAVSLLSGRLSSYNQERFFLVSSGDRVGKL